MIIERVSIGLRSRLEKLKDHYFGPRQPQKDVIGHIDERSIAACPISEHHFLDAQENPLERVVAERAIRLAMGMQNRTTAPNFEQIQEIFETAQALRISDIASRNGVIDEHQTITTEDGVRMQRSIFSDGMFVSGTLIEGNNDEEGPFPVKTITFKYSGPTLVQNGESTRSFHNTIISIHTRDDNGFSMNMQMTRDRYWIGIDANNFSSSEDGPLIESGKVYSVQFGND